METNETIEACNICGLALEPVYTSSRSVSITSLCELIPAPTNVFFCQNCGHLRTREIVELGTYYNDTYKIMIESEAEDQLYAVVDGRKIFRTEHQIGALLEKVHLREGALVLDYGCAKGALMKQLKELRPDIVPHLFDVSEMYLPFWEKFATAERWAVYEPKPAWHESFDLVMSFYAFEHMAEPRSALARIASMLKAGGHFYCVVPNVFANVADFVVVDHVNHFSMDSWKHLLEISGFAVEEIDDHSHESALVVRARKLRSEASSTGAAATAKSNGLHPLNESVQKIARYWERFAQGVQKFEQSEGVVGPAAIYGSGFYGTFIATCLKDFSQIACFLDQNPFRQTQTLLEKKILRPEDLPSDIRTIYVGLNPLTARANIEMITEWKNKDLRYFWP